MQAEEAGDDGGDGEARTGGNAETVSRSCPVHAQPMIVNSIYPSTKLQGMELQ